MHRELEKLTLGFQFHIIQPITANDCQNCNFFQMSTSESTKSRTILRDDQCDEQDVLQINDCYVLVPHLKSKLVTLITIDPWFILLDYSFCKNYVDESRVVSSYHCRFIFHLDILIFF